MINRTLKKQIQVALALLILMIFTIDTATAQKELQIGTKAPGINAIDHNNKTFNLETELKDGPVVLIFYRGEWCKYCNLYMNDLADSLSFITDRGANIIAVTPESNEYIDVTVEKSNATFSIIYDEGHEIMDAYDVTWHVSALAHLFYKLSGKNINRASKNSDRALPVPATYIIGQDGKIKGSYFNKDYTKRMPISSIVNVLESL